MKTKLFKGDPTLNAVTLVVAGVVGGATGMGVEHLSLLGTLGISILVGLVTGGLLYALLSIWKRRRSS